MRTHLSTNLDRYAAAHAFRCAAAARRHMLAFPHTIEREQQSLRFWLDAARSWRALAGHHSPAWSAELNHLLSRNEVVL